MHLITNFLRIEARLYRSYIGFILFLPAMYLYRILFGWILYPLSGEKPPRTAAGQRRAALLNERAHWVIAPVAAIGSWWLLYPIDPSNPSLAPAAFGLIVLNACNAFAIALSRYRRCRCTCRAPRCRARA